MLPVAKHPLSHRSRTRMVSSDEDIQNFAYEGRDTSWKVVFPNRAETGGQAKRDERVDESGGGYQ